MLTPEQEAEAERRQRFILKQLVFFWPLISNADDADRVEHLNYWLCVSYAGWNLFSGLLSLFVYRTTPPSLVPILIVVFIVIFYFLGANGVRQNSVAAAWGMAIYTSVPVLVRLYEDDFKSTMFLFFLGSLVVLRGTVLTARWRCAEAATPNPLRLADILPFQFSTGLSRSISNQWPPVLWHRLRWLFWLVGAIGIAEPIFLPYSCFAQHDSQPYQAGKSTPGRAFATSG
jgi:hypothetical protein